MVAKIKNRHHNHTARHTRPRGVSLKAFERTYWPYLPVALLLFLLVAALSDGMLHTAAKPPFAAAIVAAAALLSII